MTRSRHTYQRQRVCSPEAIINTSNRQQHTRYRDGDTGDIIETILYMDADSARWVRDDVAADCLTGDTELDTLRNVWAFVKRNNRYQADRAGHEQVQSPGALFAARRGDCKSYSIATGALLRALGIPYKYRFTAYDNGEYTHVYIVAKTGHGWIPLDAVHDKPLEEVRYTKKHDVAPRVAISGIGIRPPADKATAKQHWLIYALVGILIYKLA